MSWFDWTIEGSVGLPIRGKTDYPCGDARGVAIVAHGYTGNLQRNVVPVVSRGLARMGMIAHRFTMTHAGVGEDGDTIEDLDLFERDSVAHCMTDIRAVVDSVRTGELDGGGVPMVLVGHSRGGAQVLGLAGRLSADGAAPAGVVSIAGTATYTRFTDELRAEIDEKGYVERECGRAAGGTVRLGRSWYEHHLDNPGRDLFAEDLAGVTCPAMVCHAEGDDSVPFEHAGRIVELLEHARVETHLSKIGDHNFDSHGLSGEDDEVSAPSREMLGAIRRFLDSVL